MAISIGKASNPAQQLTSAVAATAATKAKAALKAVAPVKAAAAKPTPAAVVSLGRAPVETPTYSASASKSKVESAKPAAVSGNAKQAAAAKPTENVPAAFVVGDGLVAVDIKASDSGYDNKIYWSADNWKTRNYLGIDNQTATIELGSFKKGTTIEFGIDNGNGDFFKTGSAAANSDNFRHARVDAANGGVTIGFEDLRGGGDQDFNDAIISVRSLPRVSAPEKPETTGNPRKTPDNRSGLGDGTNPGQGKGQVNSPNTGTDNPNNKPIVAKPKTHVTSVVDVVPAAPVVAKPIKPSKPASSVAVKNVRNI